MSIRTPLALVLVFWMALSMATYGLVILPVNGPIGVYVPELVLKARDLALSAFNAPSRY